MSTDLVTILALIGLVVAFFVAIVLIPWTLEMRSRSRYAGVYPSGNRALRRPRWFTVYVIGVIVAEIALAVGVVAAAAAGQLALAITAAVAFVLFLALGGRLTSALVRLLRGRSDHAR